MQLSVSRLRGEAKMSRCTIVRQADGEQISETVSIPLLPHWAVDNVRTRKPQSEVLEKDEYVIIVPVLTVTEAPRLSLTSFYDDLREKTPGEAHLSSCLTALKTLVGLPHPATCNRLDSLMNFASPLYLPHEGS
jgi:hypothetical protein